MSVLDWAKYQTKLLLPSRSLATHWRWLTGPPSCCCGDEEEVFTCDTCQPLTAPATLTLILSGGAAGDGSTFPPITACADCDCLDGSHTLAYDASWSAQFGVCRWGALGGCFPCAFPNAEAGLLITIVKENSGSPDFIQSVVMFAQGFVGGAQLFEYTKTVAGPSLPLGDPPPPPDCSIFDEILTETPGRDTRYCNFGATCRVISGSP